MTILITAFEPFGGAETNPSLEAMALVPEQIGQHMICKLLLPVEYTRAASLMLEEIRRVRPEIVISCGVANGRKGITPEKLAINYRSAAIADNADVKYAGVPIDAAGPAAYMTGLPVERMVEALQAAELPAYLSLSAGAYVCNDVYYALLASESELGHRGMFLHVPGVEVATPEQTARAIVICIQAAGESLSQ